MSSPKSRDFPEGRDSPEGRDPERVVGEPEFHMATPVSPDDVVRVVGRALAEGTRRIRLTYGQRRAIVNASPVEGTARG